MNPGAILHNDIKEFLQIKEHIKSLRKQQNEIYQAILEYMKNNQLPSVIYTDKLTKKEYLFTIAPKPITPRNLKTQMLEEELKDKGISYKETMAGITDKLKDLEFESKEVVKITNHKK